MVKLVSGTMAYRKKVALTQSRIQSAISNGSKILSQCDHRLAPMRRMKDLLQAYCQDAGGEDILSQGQRSLIRRAVVLEIQLEKLESKFANNDGSASARDLDLYGRTSGQLRRIVESLELHKGRIARDISTPTVAEYVRYLNANGAGAEQ